MRYQIPAAYREPVWGGVDPRLRKSLAFSGSLATIVLLVVALAPLRVVDRTVENVPERLAKLILAEKKPTPIAPPAPSRVEMPVVDEPVANVKEPEQKKAEAKPDEPKTKPKLQDVGRRRQKLEPRAGAKGQAGRTRAQKDLSKSVAAATKSVESTLENLSADLSGLNANSGVAKPTRRRGTSKVRRGRGAEDLGGAVAARSDVGSEAEVEGSLISTSQIDIEAITEVGGDLASSDPDFVTGGNDSAASGAYRSNASLIAVVRKYAAGIQFCYDNELKRSPGLDGKMVIVLTVLPSGEVHDATIQQDTLGSGRLQECVLTQINAWKFPAIAEGTVTFRTPFVFTPPSN
jgi:TonB family protein